MRLLTVLAATAVAAAVATVISIPAGAGERADPDAAFVACLRAEGLAIPADARGVAIKQWARRHSASPGTERAFAACKPQAGEKPDGIVECLRGQGLEPPAAIEQLKPWLERQLADKDASRACGVAKGVEKLECGGGEYPKEGEPASRQ